jgi:hypothetical protein
MRTVLECFEGERRNVIAVVQGPWELIIMNHELQEMEMKMSIGLVEEIYPVELENEKREDEHRT